MPTLVVILVLLFLGLLVYGHARVSTATDHRVADGAVALVLATVVGCVLAAGFVAETF